MREALRVMWELGWKVGLILVAAMIVATSCQADEPYVEAWAIRGQAFTRNYPGVTKTLFEQRGYWGGELLARLPVYRWALIGRFSTEGAAGAHAFKDPGTWHRLVAEAALGYGFELSPRFGCEAFCGAGFSEDIQRGRAAPLIGDERNELEGPPPVYGFGAHCRDDRHGTWVNLRGEWDDAVGSGLHPALTIHLPLGGRAAVGIDAVFGDYAKIQLQMKARLLRWGP